MSIQCQIKEMLRTIHLNPPAKADYNRLGDSFGSEESFHPNEHPHSSMPASSSSSSSSLDQFAIFKSVEYS